MKMTTSIFSIDTTAIILLGFRGRRPAEKRRHFVIIQISSFLNSGRKRGGPLTSWTSPSASQRCKGYTPGYVVLGRS
jgi:hypothetical protein